MKRLKNAIKYIVDWSVKDLTRTEIVKLLYLADLRFAKKNGSTLTGIDYEYYHYGPYNSNIRDCLREMNGNILLELESFTVGEGRKYFLYRSRGDDRLTAENCSLNEEEINILDHTLNEFGDMELDELLEHVYNNTEPMKKARPGEVDIIEKYVLSNV